ncbi:hypothetical protein L9F63_024350 [Diploptera punctata]|uniref:Gustatory receptor n=1 Tax=Diploptera punctata TaxID=6984 RepID=A0AAD7ZHL5_DIPPU|nr:hypothetical protein L9F63_024350 [Diploptera punctata]
MYYNNNNCFNQETIYGSIRPLYVLSKCVGLVPLTMIKEQRKYGHVHCGFSNSKTAITHVILLITVLVVCQCLLGIHLYYNSIEYTNAVMRTYMTELYISVNMSIVVIVCSTFKLHQELDKVIRNISFLDEMLLPSQNKTYLLTGKLLKIEIIGILFLLTTLYLFDYITWNNHVLWNICYAMERFNILVYYASLLQFINFVLLINHRFRTLNSYLTSDTASSTTSSRPEKLRKKIGVHNPKIFIDNVLFIDIYNDITLHDFKWTSLGATRANTLRMLYDSLCDVVCAVNGMYGLQMLILTIGGLVRMTASLNYAIISFNKTGLSCKIATTLLWTSLTITILSIMAGSCNSTIEVSSRTSDLLQKLMLLREIDPDTKAEINLFLQQVNVRKVRFTAWGFFTIKYSILGSVIGAVITYIVIIVQFQKMS